VAFLDEVFKANSAILNALLTLLNERQFDNGSGRVAVPLVSVVGASNELPVDESLQAFFDRFLVRVPVGPVGDASFAALLRLRSGCVTVTQPLTAVERSTLAAAAEAVPLGDDALAACAALRSRLAADGRALSDRRWRQWIGLMRTAAASEGRPAVDALDLWTAPFVAAAAPDQVPALQAWVDQEVARAVPQDAPWLTRAVEAFEAQLRVEQTAPAEGGSADDAGKLALARAIGMSGEAGTADEGGLLRIVAAPLEDRLRRRWSPVHVQARLAQTDELAAQIDAAQAHVALQAETLAARLQGRIWLPPSLPARWRQAHTHTAAVLAALQQRLLATRAGFAVQPQDDALPATPPEPVPWPADPV
jgi:MoxR-like ATPase